MPTRLTPEQRLAYSVALVAAAADGARAARVAWLNHDHQHACQRCFVLYEAPKVSKRPVVLPCSLRLPNRYPLADMRQVF